MVRSRVALIGVIALLLLSTIAAATSYAHMAQERLGRIANQTETDALFEAQPARHPHRIRIANQTETDALFEAQPA
eukprot:gene12681-17003_t